ncbi:MAG: hypothetical protein RJA36_2396 [Pseudomonadota bacterium]|jgi:PAS domain-containing protein
MNWDAAACARQLLRYRFLALLVALLLALLLGGLAALGYRKDEELPARHLLDTLAQRQAVQLEGETLRGKAMGVAALLGVNEPSLKALAQGRLAPDAPAALARLQPVRQSLGADDIFVLDASGTVVGHESVRPGATGQRWQDRPFWLHAYAGVETIFPAIEGEPRRRVLYFAAPLYERLESSGAVIGAVVLKLPADDLDVRLRQVARQALLVSPQGVVFASSDERWNFRLTHGLERRELESLRAQQQFSIDRGAGGPLLLPFDLSRDAVELQGVRHLRARASLLWPDPAGRWQLVLLAAPELGVHFVILLAVGGVVALLTLALQFMLLRLLQGKVARQEALARSEAASRELMQLAQLKTRQSEFTLRLQQARDPAELVSALFGELVRFLPVHQGSLYFAEASGPAGSHLLLAGSYATEHPPREIAYGDGLLGQCARDCRPLVLSRVPAGFWTVSTGLGASLPRSLLLLPVMRNQVLLGVLEIASLDPDPAPMAEVLDGLLPVLATNLEALVAERRMDWLLREARAQAAQAREQQQRGIAFEQWLEAVSDEAPTGLLLLDGQGRVLLSNHAARSIFGYDAKELEGMLAARLLPGAMDGSGAAAGAGGGVFEAAAQACDWRPGGRGRCKDGREVSLVFARLGMAAVGTNGPGSCLLLRPE